MPKKPVTSENKKSLPAGLKAGIQAASGMDIKDVRVHHNSPKPPQLNAKDYSKGTGIHLADGQEKHLPHETWHVVDQKLKK